MGARIAHERGANFLEERVHELIVGSRRMEASEAAKLNRLGAAQR